MRSPPDPAHNSSFPGNPSITGNFQWSFPSSLYIESPIKIQSPEPLDQCTRVASVAGCSRLPYLATEPWDPVLLPPQGEVEDICWQASMDKEINAGKCGIDESTEHFYWSETEFGTVEMTRRMEKIRLLNDFGQFQRPGMMTMSGDGCICSSFRNSENHLSTGSRIQLQEPANHNLSPSHFTTANQCGDGVQHCCWNVSPFREQLSHGNNMSVAEASVSDVNCLNSASSSAFQPVHLMESDYLECLQMPSTEDVDWLNSLPEICCNFLSVDEFGRYATTPEPCQAEAMEVGVNDQRHPMLDSQLRGAENLRTSKRPLTVSSINKRIETAAKKSKVGRETSTQFNFNATAKDEAFYDGYRWQKYGKRSVKDSPYPRNYYRCTFKGCPARKQVQNSSEDPDTVFTTYEGAHTHERPTAAPFGIIVQCSTV